MPTITPGATSEVKRTNEPKQKVSRSFFDLSHRVCSTDVYGRVQPFLHFEAIRGDEITFGANTTLRSLTLQTPQMSKIYEQKDFFAVPMQAILPFNWDLIETQPVTGDDVNSNLVSCALPFNPSSEPDIPLFSTPTGIGSSVKAGYYMLRLFLCNLLFSDDSVAKRLGYNFSSSIYRISFKTQDNVIHVFDNWDEFLDSFIDALITGANMFKLPGVTDEEFYNGDLKSIEVPCYSLANSILNNSTFIIRGYDKKGLIRDWLRCYTNDYVYRYSAGSNFDFTSFDSGASVLFESVEVSFGSVANDGKPVYLNLGYALAYQIVCSHYYTNDKIDYITTADLYRSNLLALLLAIPQFSESYFTWNGVRKRYDYCSGHYLNFVFNSQARVFSPSTFTLAQVNAFYPAFAYIQAIFGYHRSLRFEDKLVNARKTPYSLGPSMEVTVQDNKANVVDITASIQAQRFRNLINKVGRSAKEQSGKLFGVSVAYDYHDPSYLGKFRREANIYETENTANVQFTAPNNITSNIRLTSSGKGVHYEFDRTTLVIGITSYDMSRVYTDAMDRSILHINRFDYFLPQFQHIGDQQIPACSLSLDTGDYGAFNAFGYEVRNGEYKSILDTCVGGFRKYLKTWLNMYKPVQSITVLSASSISSVTRFSPISSDFIRSYPAELDRFFLSLQHNTDCGSFHFIVENFNIVNANRPIIMNPQIL